MKKVIIEQNEQVIRLEDVRDAMIIGIEWGSGRKSFLIKNENKKNHSNFTWRTRYDRMLV